MSLADNLNHIECKHCFICIAPLWRCKSGLYSTLFPNLACQLPEGFLKFLFIVYAGSEDLRGLPAKSSHLGMFVLPKSSQQNVNPLLLPGQQSSFAASFEEQNINKRAR